LFAGNTLISQPLSYIAGIFWSYTLNRKWTFESRLNIKYEIIRFFSVQVFLMMVSTGLVYLLVEVWELNESIGWLLSLSCITAMNYLLLKTVVFKA